MKVARPISLPNVGELRLPLTAGQTYQTYVPGLSLPFGMVNDALEGQPVSTRLPFTKSCTL